MRPCVPFASAREALTANRLRFGLGGSGAPACAAVAALAWLLPLESSAQHFYAGVGYGLERPPEAGPGEGDAPFLMLEGLTVVAGPAAVTTEDLAGESPELALEDRADSAGPGNRRSMSRLISPSFEIPAIGAAGENALNPFVGGGLGAVRTGSGDTGTPFAEPGALPPGATKVGTAWMVTAGVAASLSPRMTLELAWRYNHLGGAKTGRGSGRVEWRDHGRPIPTNLAPTSAEAQSHGVRLSLRYGF